MVKGKGVDRERERETEIERERRNRMLVSCRELNEACLSLKDFYCNVTPKAQLTEYGEVPRTQAPRNYHLLP
jgi:hypothetical protein